MLSSDASFYSNLLSGHDKLSIKEAAPSRATAPDRLKQGLRLEESFSSLCTFTSETPSEPYREILRIANELPEPTGIQSAPPKRGLSRWGTSDSMTMAPVIQPILSTDLQNPAIASAVQPSKHLQIQQWVQGVDYNSMSTFPNYGGRANMDQVLGNRPYGECVQSECSESDCQCHFQQVTHAHGSSVQCLAPTGVHASGRALPSCIYPPLTYHGTMTAPTVLSIPAPHSPESSSGSSTLVNDDATTRALRPRKLRTPLTTPTQRKPSSASTIKRAARNPKPTIYHCPFDHCNHTTKTNGDLKRHLQTKQHKEPSIACRYGCPTLFTRKDSEKRHAETCPEQH